MDVEHRGVPGVAAVPDTAAAGWVRELALFDDGAGNMQLAGRIEWMPFHRQRTEFTEREREG